MKLIQLIFALLLLTFSVAISQQRYEVHTRGMLRQSVFNTGDLGRPLDNGSTGAIQTMPSFEWPGNGGYPIYINQYPYQGFYNSFGGGFYIAADTARFLPGSRVTPRVFVACGAFSDNAGHNQTGDAIPIDVTRIENYPVLADGELNPAYDPDEAEEKIISRWDTPIGVTVSRTSRAWSYPDYDDFIIYDYQLDNTGSSSRSGIVDTLRAMMIACAYSLGPSMIGDMLMNNNSWLEGSMRGDKQGALSFNYARYDWHRYLLYNHTINGLPFVVGNDSILMAPGAIGILPLYYNYDLLAKKSEVSVALANNTPLSDSLLLWDMRNGDPTDKVLRQPYNISLDNGNLNLDKFKKYLDIELSRNNTPFRNGNDSTTFGTYWIGRGKPNWTNTLRNPTGKVYGFGPYTFMPHSTMHFVYAEVAGFGAGDAGDSVYSDLGGGWGSGDQAPTAEPQPGVHPPASWWYTLSYPYLNPRPNYTVMGSTYMQTHPLPDYVNSNVISIRDVADRAIQMHTGNTLVKYDTSQFDPSPVAGARSSGMYRVPIPCPAPAIFIDNTAAASNKVIWGPQVESFTTPRLHGRLHHYLVMRATNPVGPWTLLDSVSRHDPRFYKPTSTLVNRGTLVLTDSAYAFVDETSDINQSYYYAVVSVDSLGGKSGKTNITIHNTQAPAAKKMTHVYAVPNPFIVSSGDISASVGGNVSDKIGFYGLPKRATIRIFSYSGQLVRTFEHNSVDASTPDGQFADSWFQVSRNEQWVSSGVYYFVVEDKDTGDRAWNKFVIIH